MKKIVSISMGLLAILAISCSKKDSPIAKPAAEAPKGETITITVGAPEDIESKVAYAYDEAEKKLKLTWEEGDKIVLQQGDQAYPFTATTISENGKMATFTGTSAGEGTYDVFYAGKGTEAMTLSEVEDMDYTAQTQSANDNTQHLKFAARLKSVTFTPGTDDIYFTADWAKEHGNGTYQQSGAIRIRLQNPGVTSLKSVTLTAPSAIFPKTNALSETSTSLTVSLPNARIEATDPIVVYAMLPWSQDDVDLPAGDYTVSVTTEDFDVWTKTKAFEANTLSPVAVNSIGLNKTGFALQDFYGGSGVEGDPYLIANARQMGKINSHLSATKTYYKLVDDIDMTGVTWTSLNADGTNVINLDGNSKKISNMRSPLFADLNGNVHDLTLYNSVVSSAETVGILANTCNTAASTVSRVTVTGDESPTVSSLINTVSSGRVYVGGLIGEISTLSTFDDCHVKNTTVSVPAEGDYSYTGGAFGYVHHDSRNVGEIKNCTVAACIVSSFSNTGGLIGYYDRGNVKNNAVGFDKAGNEKKCTITSPDFPSIAGDNKGGLLGVHRRGFVEYNKVLCTVKGKSNIGGVTGYAYLNESNNTSSGEVYSSYTNAGGLVGYSKGDIVNCNSSCTLDGQYATSSYSSFGGLIGCVNSGSIKNCYSTGEVTFSKNQIGGLIGSITSEIADVVIKVENCYAAGNVTGTTGSTVYSGTFVGAISTTGLNSSVTISNCYSTGKLTARRWTIGFIGNVGSDGLAINNCYVASTFSLGVPTASGVFIGHVNSHRVLYSGIIAWNVSSLPYFIRDAAVTTAPSGNYFGTDGTINSQATALGWGSIVDDSSNPVWDLTWADNRPHLAWEEKP